MMSCYIKRGIPQIFTGEEINFNLLFLLVGSGFAERKGFEPLKRFRRLHTFQACAFDHSAISPFLTGQKYEKNFHNSPVPICLQ